MNKPLICILGVLALVSTTVTRAGTLYVDLNSANPTPPYSDWSTAAATIQDAIDASTDGDQIWVTDGVYQTGGKVMAGDLTNRVALNKAVTVQSVNGPFVTTIAGIGANNGPSAVRCAWLTNNAALVGFTLTRGATRTVGDGTLVASGGALWCASSNAVVSGCVIRSNSAVYRGGGAYQGTLYNCFISSNSVPGNVIGGAVYSAVLNNCTVVSNSSSGLASCQATNSICYYNGGNNYYGGNFSYSCVAPAAAGTGNFTNVPIFFLDRIHLALGSPGAGAGTTAVTGTDIFGKPWAVPPSVGCAEAGGLPLFTSPQMKLMSAPVGFTIGNVQIAGVGPFAFNWLRNGAPLQDDGHLSGTESTNLIATGVNFSDAGNYQLVISNTSGAVTSAVAQVVIHCVDAGASNPVAPYSSWQTAATNIQDAIDAALTNEFVLVTNGVYASGGKVMSGDLTNRVVLDKAIITTSVNGFASTVIEGQWDPATNGPAAVRCAWLTNGAALSGFTLRNGATRGGNVITSDLQYGGGAWLSSNALISNCVLTNNSSRYAGGGVAFGTVNNSFIGHNSSTHGGGAYSCRLNNCTVRQNYVFSGNSNTGGGVELCASRNCIISENYDSPFAINTSNYPLSFIFGETFTNCCTTPLPLSRGMLNITNSPLFLNYADGFALSPASPCRGMGNPLFATGNDLDGEPYLNPPSMGCDEIITSNLSGPLSFSFPFLGTNTITIVNHRIFFATSFEGRASELDWSFGDGPTVTNLGAYLTHAWTNTGTYTVTLTAYNLDHPSGVSSNLFVTVVPLLVPSLQSAGMVSNAFQFSVPIQGYGTYSVQYTTNLTPPVSWQTLPVFLFSTNDTIMPVRDPAITNGARFYRITAQ